MSRLFRIALVAGLSSLSLVAGSAQAKPAAPSVSAATPAAKLKALFSESDEASLKRNPINALYRGDFRYADRLGDYVTPAYFNAERAASQDDLRRLNAIDRAALNATDDCHIARPSTRYSGANRRPSH
jgi:uncharacterized protein (DUF885 family)